MAMTAEVKDELSRLVVNSVSARRAEVAALLRFAGGLHIVSGRVVVEAEVDLGIIARRLRKDIYDLYGYHAVVHVLSASGYPQEHPVRGARRQGRGGAGAPDGSAGSAGGARCAACRRRWSAAVSPTPKLLGAERFSRNGSLTEPGRSSALEVSCPGPEAALALVGAARRLGV